MKIVFALNAQQKGFFISLGQHFEKEGHEVFYLMLKPGLGTYFENKFGLPKEKILDPVNEEFNEMPNVLDIEEKYETTFSYLMAQDRGLGRGYFLNIEKYPNRPDAWISQEKKNSYLLKEFQFAEHVVEKIKPDIVMELFIPVVHNLVFNKINIPVIGLGPARYANNYCLQYNGALQSYLLEEKVEEFLSDKKLLEEFIPYSFEREPIANEAHSNSQWSYFKAVKDCLGLLKREIARLRRNKFKQDERDYYPFAWFPTRFRKIRNFKYLMKSSVKPGDLSNKKVVFFPLHLEPEVALMTVSPEFSNSLEAISWISKSLPSDYVLVVKEHPMSLGNRSKSFYTFLKQISNVELADINVHSWEWINQSVMVATITGTVGYEGVFFRKPVLSYGKHQIINKLPTVEYVDNYESTREAFKRLVRMDDAGIFEHSHKALAKAIIETSFDLPDFDKTYKKTHPMPEAAEICYNKIMDYYPLAKEKLKS